MKRKELILIGLCAFSLNSWQAHAMDVERISITCVEDNIPTGYEYYRKHDNGTEIGGGKCGPYVGECMNSGAPKELTKKANLHILPISCCEGYRTYVLNPVYAQIIPEDPEIMDYMMDLNSPSGYKLFVQHTDDGCIPPYEMNYYLGKSQEIIQHFKPIGKEPICCEYFWAEWLGTDIGNRVLDSFHGMWITYAEIHCEYVGFDQ